MLRGRAPKQSLTITTEHVLPNDTNALGNLYGGRLLQWMDTSAAIAAHRHCRRVVVTATVNHVSFNQPIKLGSIITLESKVSRAFSTSVEVFIDVFVENPISGIREQCNEAIYTFVAIDQNGSPVPVPEVLPETEQEKERFVAALRRRQLSLILAGKLKPDDAPELKALVTK